MAAGQNRLSWVMDWKVDQQSFNQILTQLKQIQSLTVEDLNPLTNNKELEKQLNAQLNMAKKSASELENIMNRAFNAKLNTVNLTQLRHELNSLQGGVQSISAGLNSIGPAGTKAFNDFSTKIFTTNVQLKESNKLLNEMWVSMKNTMKWGITSSIFNNVTNSISQAWNYTKKLDTSLNDIRIVTGKSAEEMEKFALYANKAAGALGKTTTDYTEASLIYYQQGLSEEAVRARTSATLKAANVTGQSTSAVSEQLTAVWNGFNLDEEEIEKVELYVDKLAAVAATTASDLEELSTGMSKVASAANLMGVGIDELSAQLATIVSVTRQAPESVGTALKTIYARMGDIEAGTDAETTLGEYTSKMAELGVNVLDADGKLRAMGEVITEIGNKWSKMTKEQQVALSQVMAGTRQYNNLLSLFNNWDMYTDALKISQNAAGTLQEQQDIYMQSVAAHFEQFSAAGERLFKALTNNDVINDFIDGVTTATNGIATFVEAIGGMQNVIAIALNSMLQAFSQNIGTSVATFFENRRKTSENELMQNAKMSIAEEYLSRTGNIAPEDYTNQLAKMVVEFGKYRNIMTETQQQEANAFVERKAKLLDEQAQLELTMSTAEKYAKAVQKMNKEFYDFYDKDKVIKDRQGLNTSKGAERQKFNLNFAYDSSTVLDQNLKIILDNLRETWDTVINDWETGLEHFKADMKKINSTFSSRPKYIEDKNKAWSDITETRSKLEYNEAELAKIQTKYGKNTKGFEKDLDAQILQEQIQNLKEDLEKYKSKYIGITEDEINMRREAYKKLKVHFEALLKATAQMQHFTINNELFTSEEEQLEFLKATSHSALQQTFGEVVEGTNLPVLALYGEERVKEDVDNIEAVLQDAVDAIDSAQAGIAGKVIETKKLVKGNVKESHASIKEAIANVDKQANTFLQHFDMATTIGATSSLVGQFGQLASVLMNIMNIPKIWNNENLTGMEKFVQILSNITMTFSLMLNSITGIAKNFPIVKAGITSIVTALTHMTGAAAIVDKYTDGMAKLNPAMERQAVIAIRMSQLWSANAAALESYNEEQREALRLKLLNQATSEADYFLNNKELVTRMKHQADATEKATKSTSLFGNTALGALGITKALAVKIGIVAGAFAVLGVAIYAIVKAYNAESDAAKAMVERQKEVAEAYADIKNKYDELKNSLSNYDEARKNIENMVEGTREWRDAVRELNDEVFKLLSTYPELAKYVTNENGVLTLSQEGKDEITRKEEEKVNAEGVRQKSATIINNNAQLQQELKENREKIRVGISYSAVRTEKNGLDEKKYRDNLQSMAIFNEEKFQELLNAYNVDPSVLTDKEKLKEILPEDVIKKAVIAPSQYDKKSIQIDYDKTYDNLIAALQQNSEIISNANTAIVENTTQNQILREAIVKEAIAGKESETYQKSDYKQNIDSALALRYEQYEQEALEKYNKMWDTDVHQEYAKINPNIEKEQFGWFEWGDATFKMKGSDTPQTYQDINMRKELAANEAAERIRKEEEALSKEIEAMAAKSSKYGKEASAALLQTYNKRDQVSNIDFTKVAPETVQELKSNFIEVTSLTDEEAKKLGYESASAYATAVSKALADYDPIEHYLDKASKYAESSKKIQAVEDVLSKGPESDLEEEQLQYLKKLENEYTVLGEIQDRTSHQYLNTLSQIQEYEEAQRTNALISAREEQVKDLKSKSDYLNDLLEKQKNGDKSPTLIVEIAAKTDAVEEALEKLENTDREIKVAVKADIESDWKSGFNLAEEFGKLSDLATEDLLLSFDEAQELIANGYGEVLNNARETTTDQIKLSKAQLTAFVADRRLEMEEDRTNKIKQLEGEREIVRAKKKVLEQKITYLEQGLKADTTATKIESLLAAQKAQAEVDAYDLTLKTQVKHEDLANEQKYKNAEKLAGLLGTVEQTKAENATQGQKDTADAAYESASAQISYANQIGETVEKVSKTIRLMWTGWAQYEPTELQKQDVTATVTTPTAVPTENAYKVDTTGWTQDDWETNIKEILAENNATEDEQLATLNAELEKQLAEARREKKLLGEQEGSLSAAIAALKTSGKTLDTNLANAGKGKGGKDADHEDFEDKYDLYHDINIEIQQITNRLEELQEREEEAFGTELVENLRKQIALLDAQIENYEQKISIAEEEAAGLQQTLTDEYGFLFYQDGTIANYKEVYDREADRYKKVLDAYNNMSPEEQEKYEQTKKDAEDRWEHLFDTFERYDTLITEDIPEMVQSQLDEENQKIEKQMEKFNLEIELRLDVAEAEREWNDFKKKMADDDLLTAASMDLESLYTYFDKNGEGLIPKTTQHVKDIQKELEQMDITGESDVYGNDRQKALKDLQNYYQELMDNLQDAEEKIEDIKQSYVDMMKEAQDAFADQVGTYKQIASILNHDMKIIKLLNGEDSYKELEAYYKQLEKNNRQQIDFQRQQVDFWKNEMDSLDPVADKEAWEAAKKNWQSAVNELNSQLEASIENLQDKYLNTIERIFDDLNDKITNGKGLEYISEEWDLLGQNSDEFLDEINSLYGIESIAQKYQEAMDNTDNLSVQKKLRDVMEQELEALREKDKLTEYDIERAEKKYDLTLKQIALEEAQQNKSQLRLRRDSQGNYTYQYVADEDEINNLEKELAAAQNELYNFDLEQYKDKLSQVYDVYEEFQDKMKEAAQINDPEERAARELLLQQQYGELINGLIAQNEDIRNNLYESAFAELAALRDQDLIDYTQLTQQQKDLLMNDLIPQWNSGMQEMVDAFSGEGGFIPTCKDSMEELDEATDEYQRSVNKLEKAAGADFDAISRGIDETAEATRELVLDNKDLITSYENELTAIGNVLTELDELILKYEAAKLEAEAATKAAYEYWRAATNTTADEAGNDKHNPIESIPEQIKPEAPKVEEAPVEEEPVVETSGGDGVISLGDTATYIGGSGGWFADSYGEGSHGIGPKDLQVVINQIGDLDNPYVTHPYHIKGKGWVRKDQLKGYDTGGYTGAWGDEGKLALLHQKELVLNAQDTLNMLNAVDILRDITNTIGSTMLNKLAQINGNANGLLAHVGAETMEQNVHIDATFPNVQNSNEIEEAFKNLTNIAAQRAYRS